MAASVPRTGLLNKIVQDYFIDEGCLFCSVLRAWVSVGCVCSCCGQTLGQGVPISMLLVPRGCTGLFSSTTSEETESLPPLLPLPMQTMTLTAAPFYSVGAANIPSPCCHSGSSRLHLFCAMQRTHMEHHARQTP